MIGPSFYCKKVYIRMAVCSHRYKYYNDIALQYRVGRFYGAHPPTGRSNKIFKTLLMNMVKTPLFTTLLGRPRCVYFGLIKNSTDSRLDTSAHAICTLYVGKIWGYILPIGPGFERLDGVYNTARCIRIIPQVRAYIQTCLKYFYGQLLLYIHSTLVLCITRSVFITTTTGTTTISVRTYVFFSLS